MRAVGVEEKRARHGICSNDQRIPTRSPGEGSRWQGRAGAQEVPGEAC